MHVPQYTNFKLTNSIEDVPAGTTGQLKRLDSHHVAMFFNDRHPDLVFDVNDTEPEVWASIVQHTVNPSMVDPPRWYARIAAAVAVAFILGWFAEDALFIQDARAAAIEYVLDIW